MITISLNEANFEYDIHSLVKSFFPKEEVKVSADKGRLQKLEEEETPFLRMEITYRRPEEGEPVEVPLDGSNAHRSSPGEIGILLYIPLPGSHSMGGSEGTAGLAAGNAGGTPHWYGEEANASPIAQETVLVDFMDRKGTKDRLKRCLYQMLSQYTGQKLPWGTLTGIRPTKIPTSLFGRGIGEDEIREYMADTYLATEAKINLSIEIAKQEIKLLRGVDYKDGYSLYIGIPFCPSICSYCSFSSSPIGLWEGRVEAYLEALGKELDFTSKACRDKKLNSVYIGGGTPTTLSPNQLDRLLTKVESKFNLSNLAEYTVEAGRPDSITKEKLKTLRSHGISRISINPQTMKQETLDIIGRRHTVAQVIESFWLAREMGFGNINMDLIVGLPGERAEDVADTLRQIEELSPDSLTVHSLAIKRAAKLKMFAEDYAGLTMESSWEQMDMASRCAKSLGMLPYYLYRQKNMAGNFENVGYARPGKAGIYNILMMEEKQSILAVGAGAATKYVFASGEAGEVRVERTENVKDITHYITRVEEMIDRKRGGLRKHLGWDV